jgi:hypothetical protein
MLKRSSIFPTIILSFIVFVGLAVRIYRLPEIAVFGPDQEFAAEFARSVLQVYPMQLIGQGLSFQGLFMGPLYFYYLVPFFALSRLHPIGGYIGSIMLGLVTILCYFYVIKKIFGTRAALIATSLRALLFVYIQADLLMTPAFSGDLVALLTWYGFYHYWRGHTRYLLLLGFLFGLYTSFHPILFPFYVVFVVLVILKRKLPSVKLAFLSLLLFLAPISPLLLFEYWHDFLEVKLLLAMGSNTRVSPEIQQTLMTYIGVLYDLPRMLFGPGLARHTQLLFWISFITAVFIFFKRKKDFGEKSFHLITMAIIPVVFVLWYTFLPKPAPPYYFLGIQTVFFIYFVAVLDTLLSGVRGVGVVFIVLTLIVFSNSLVLYNSWHSLWQAGLFHKEAIVKEIARREPTNQMHIFFDTEMGQAFGFDYLLRYYQVEPRGDATDPTYTIVLLRPPGLRRNRYMGLRSGFSYLAHILSISANTQNAT